MCAKGICTQSPLMTVLTEVQGVRGPAAPAIATLPYADLICTFPKPLPRNQETIFGSLSLRDMLALSLHSNIPDLSVRRISLTTNPSLLKMNVVEDSDDEDQEPGSSSGDVLPKSVKKPKRCKYV